MLLGHQDIAGDPLQLHVMDVVRQLDTAWWEEERRRTGGEEERRTEGGEKDGRRG